MSPLHKIIEEQRETLGNLWREEHNIEGNNGTHPLYSVNHGLPAFEAFLSTIQNEILNAVKEKVEGMEYKEPVCVHNKSWCSCVDDEIMKIEGYNAALSDLSSWLEGEIKK